MNRLHFLKLPLLLALLVSGLFAVNVASNDLSTTIYTSLQAAVNSGTNNFTIFLLNNPTAGDKALITNQSNITITTDPSVGSPITLFGDSISTGLKISNSTFITISNILFTRWSNAIVLDNGSSSNKISFNIITSNSGSGIVLVSNQIANELSFNNISSNSSFTASNLAGCGIYLMTNTVLGTWLASNTLYNNFFGIRGDGALSTYVSNNIVNSIGAGLLIVNRQANSNTIFGNVALGNTNGFFIASGYNNVSTNLVTWNSNYGMRFENHRFNVVYSNEIDYNANYGLYFAANTNGLVMKNYIFSNTNGGLNIDSSTRLMNVLENTSSYNFSYANLSSFGEGIATGGVSNTFLSNTVVSNRRGFVTTSAGMMNISYNFISGNSNYSIWCNTAALSNSTIMFNTIISVFNGGGIGLNSNAVSNQIFSNSVTGAANGITLGSVGGYNSNNFVYQNYLFNNSIGVAGVGGSNSIVSNWVLSNTTGISLTGGSTNVLVYGNKCFSNANNGIIQNTAGLFCNIINNQCLYNTVGFNMANGCVSNVIASNYIFGSSQNGMVIAAQTNNLFWANESSSNGVSGMQATGVIAGNVFTSNIFASNVGRGFYLGNGTAANYSNYFSNNSFISNGSFGLDAYQSFNDIFSGNIAISNTVAGFNISSFFGTNLVIGNLIQGNGYYGINLASSIVVANNFASNIIGSNQVGAGIIISQSGYSNTFDGNTIFGHSNGIYIGYVLTNGVFTGNQISGASSNGIALNLGSLGSWFQGNSITTNGYDGIKISGVITNTVFIGNILSSNAYDGLDITSAAYACTFMSNTALSNFSSGIDIRSSSTSNAFIGNFSMGNISNGFNFGSASSTNYFLQNTLSGNNFCGLWFNSGSGWSNLLVSNNFFGPAQLFGFGNFSPGSSNVFIYNDFASNASVNRTGTLANNVVYAYNTFRANTNGLGFGGANFSMLVVSNIFRDNVNNAISINTGTSNFFGSNYFSNNGTGLNNSALSSSNTFDKNYVLNNKSFGFNFSAANNDLVLNNTFAGNSNGLYYSGMSTNILISNNNFYNSSQVFGLKLTNGPNNIFVWDNVFSGNGNVGLSLGGVTNIQVYSNDFSSNGFSGLGLNTATTGISVLSNRFWGNNTNAVIVYNGATGNNFVSNTIDQNLGVGLTIAGANNTFLLNAIVNNAGAGLLNSATGEVVNFNWISNNGLTNLYSSTATVNFYSNDYGVRDVPSKKLFGLAALEPWANTLGGLNGDWIPPSAPVTLVATNVSTQVYLTWEQSVAGDFSNYSIYRSTNSGGYSNLLASDLLSNVYVAATTNIQDTLPKSGSYNYFVTVWDTNRNESPYSPRSNVTIASSIPVLTVTNPIATFWITNANQIFAGTGSSSYPLTGLWFQTNNSTGVSKVLGTTNWSTNGPWTLLNRTTNISSFFLSNSDLTGSTLLVTNAFELTAPPFAFKLNYANTVISNQTNITVALDSYSALTNFTLQVYASAGALVSSYNLLPSLSGTNLSYALDTTAFTNGRYDFIMFMTNVAGYALGLTNTNVFFSNAAFPPTLVITNPSPMTAIWITNSNQIYAGTNYSLLSPITGTFLRTNNGPFSVISFASNWMTNGPWGGLNRATNTLTFLVSNFSGAVISNVLTNYFELYAPPMSFKLNYAGNSLSNTTNILGSLDSYSPLTHFSLSVLDGVTQVSNINLIPVMTGTNFTLPLNTVMLTNGSYNLVLAATNSAGYQIGFTNLAVIVTNVPETPPTLTCTNPAPVVWITNVNQVFSGTASSASNALVGVWLSTNATGSWAKVLGSTNWSTNGPWTTLNRTTTIMNFLTSNSVAKTYSQTNSFELTMPPFTLTTPLSNTNLISQTNLIGTLYSFSTLTAFNLKIYALGNLVSNVDLSASLSSTNFNYFFNSKSLTNGTYDFVYFMSNVAGWYQALTNTNIYVTNGPLGSPAVFTLVPVSNNQVAAAGVPYFFNVYLYDAASNFNYSTSISLTFSFSGLTPNAYGSNLVNGSNMGLPSVINFVNGVASNIALIPTTVGTQALIGASTGFTAWSNFNVSVEHGLYSSSTSIFSAVNTNFSTKMAFPVTVSLKDAYGNNVLSNGPAFVFVRSSVEGNARDITLIPGGGNQYTNAVMAHAGNGHYDLTAYVDSFTETNRLKQDTQDFSEGKISFDLYEANLANLKTLMDMEVNRGGVVITQNPVVSGSDLQLYYNKVTGQSVQVSIYDMAGGLVKKFTLVDSSATGLQWFNWKAVSSTGANLSPGVYFVLLAAENPYTKKYFKMVVVK